MTPALGVPEKDVFGKEDGVKIGGSRGTALGRPYVVVKRNGAEVGGLPP